MKSLLAVLAIGLALGGGYWKMQNPNGGLADLTSQGQATVNRLKIGFEAVKSGASPQSTDNGLMAGGSALQTQMRDMQSSMEGRLQSIEDNYKNLVAATSQSEEGIGPLEDRLAELEAHAADATDAESNTALADLSARLETIDSAQNDWNSRINAQEERVTAFETQTAEAGTALSQQNTAITANVQELGEKVDTLIANADNDELVSAVKSLSDKTTEIEQRTGAIESTTAALPNNQEINQRFTALGNQLGTIAATNGDSAAAAKLTAGMDDRLASIENSVTVLQQSISTPSESEMAVANTLDAVNGQLDELRARVNALATPDASANSSEDNSERLAGYDSALASLEAGLSELRGQFEDLGTSSEPASIESSQTRLQEQLATLEGKVSDAPSPADITAMSKALEVSRERIKLLESRVSQMPSTSNEAGIAKKAQDSLQNQIAALEVRLAGQSSAPNEALASSLSVVQKKVQELESAKRQNAKSKEYKIYFGKNSTEISKAAAKVLNSFITQEKNRATGLAIYGFTDRTGDASYNQRLALRRANNVRSYLIQSGFDFKKINAVDGIGEDLAAASASDGKEDANQRTVVLYAFQP